MASDKKPASSPKGSQEPKPATAPVSEMLTPSEKETLRREAREASDLARKAFAHLRPKKTVASSPEPDTSPASEMLTSSEIESLRREAREADALAKKAFAHLRPKKPPAAAVSEMLTDSEKESLRQKARETEALAKKAFGHLRPKVIYTIMPDYGGVYGWMKREGTRGIGTIVGHNEGWEGEHPISSGLHEAFAAWQDRFEKSELSDNGRIEDFDWEAFHRDGIALARRLKAEVGDKVRVIYDKPAGDPLHKIEEWREVLAGGGLLVLDPRR